MNKYMKLENLIKIKNNLTLPEILEELQFDCLVHIVLKQPDKIKLDAVLSKRTDYTYVTIV